MFIRQVIDLTVLDVFFVTGDKNNGCIIASVRYIHGSFFKYNYIFDEGIYILKKKSY